MDDSNKPGGEPPVGAWGSPPPARTPTSTPPAPAATAEPEPPISTEPVVAPPASREAPAQFEAPLPTAPRAATETVQRLAPSVPSQSERVAPPRPRGRGWLWLVLVAAIAGAWFSGTSTADFVEHLDGQLHDVHCSINPAASQADGDAASGCVTAMFSPYSSVLRTTVWGGVPIALFGFAVFAFLGALAVGLALKRDVSRRDTLFLLIGTLLPVGTSAVYATISATELGSFCTMCIGVYVASGLMFVLSLVAHLRARPGDQPRPDGPDGQHAGVPWGRWGLWLLEGVLVVGAVLLLYMALVPSERPSVDQGCGALVEAPGQESFVLSLPSEPGAVPALEVVDPLCNHCRVLDQRLAASGFDKQLARKLVVFPMDTCIPNDMVRQRLHPGACTVSYAMLCAPASAGKILDYAFREQERLLELGKTNEAALRADLEKSFPEVKGCIGSAKVKAELTKVRNWAARNALALSTPQLYVDGVQVCPQNIDLGLEFSLTRALERARAPRAGGAP